VFTEDGQYALTADEGEPNTTYTIDPPGTVSIIDVAAVRSSDSRKAVRKVGFDRFDLPDQRALLDAEGVRIFGPGASVAQDLEPEYIAVRRNKAYVTLQENNALAIINIAGATVEKIIGLGQKDHSLPENALDASDQDSAINIRDWPIFGLYQPDAIDVIEAGGQTYLIMANEGDAREYAAYVETVRLNSASYVLDTTVFPNAAALKANTALGRLNVTTATGDLDGDGDFDRIDALGGRSVSIRDHQGNLVWDSANAFELLSKQFDGSLTVFNTTNTANSKDNRSDDKGVEPESVVVGEVHGRLYAFVGLERDSGIVVLDVTDPASPVIVNYVNNRKLPRTSSGGFQACSNTVDCGDLGPEGLTFVPASKSPTGRALLLVSNEVSSTTTIWEIE
jgi:2',3'-cyclic-nucleotide 2'-phosphodiesterase / 3'-nucleotidase / 5'-nucleotidase